MSNVAHHVLPRSTACILGTAIVLFTVETAQAVTVDISPQIQGHVIDNGFDGFDSLEENVPSLEVVLESTLEQRGVLEFGLTSIPAGASISSAVLSDGGGGCGFGGFGDPLVFDLEMHGFAGDGNLTLSDATVPDNLLDSVNLLAIVFPPLDSELEVPSSFLQPLHESGDVAGLMLKLTGNAAGSCQFFQPTLHVTFDPVPEPNTLGLSLIGVLVLSVGRCRRQATKRD